MFFPAEILSLTTTKNAENPDSDGSGILDNPDPYNIGSGFVSEKI